MCQNIRQTFQQFFSTLEVNFNVMRSISLHLTYFYTYVLVYLETVDQGPRL